MVSVRNPPKIVCVIGAGPSGLVAARELKKEGHKVVVLEQNHDVGGQWLYDPRLDQDGKAIHSSIYESLRLTSPREIMGFTDFPFLMKKGRDTRRFPGHKELLLYLKDFCEWFGLREMIRFNTRVEYVGIQDYGGLGKDLRWIVKSKLKDSDHKVVAQVFDAVVVVVVGNSLSGQDISMELVNVAKEIHISAKSPAVSEGLSKVISKYDNLHLHPICRCFNVYHSLQIECLHEDGRVVFADGSWLTADTIIYCTGYSYSFPFLDTKGAVAVDDDRVGPLYEHTFPPNLAPSLSFIGIPRKIIGFPFFESQAKWIAQLLSGKRTLPSRDEMMKSIHDLYQSREAAGIPKHNTHDVADFEVVDYTLTITYIRFGFFWKYCDKYGDHVGFPHLEEWRKDLCISALINSDVNLETYRDHYDDEQLLQVAHQSPHFTQLEAEAVSL
ncbi:Flavin monooxygenase FMO, partial [Cynara cardunculus var. scolymus]